MELLDVLTLRILHLFRVGPWYCNQCERKSYLLKLSRWNYSTRPDVDDATQGDEADSETGFEPAGNYIKAEQSLVMRENRASRFSQKYRDAAVLRILTGDSTISQTRRDLKVSEKDLIDWMANLFTRKEEKIAELTEAIDNIRSSLPQELRLTLEAAAEGSADVEDPKNVIDGRESIEYVCLPNA